MARAATAGMDLNATFSDGRSIDRSRMMRLGWSRWSRREYIYIYILVRLCVCVCVLYTYMTTMRDVYGGGGYRRDGRRARTTRRSPWGAGAAPKEKPPLGGGAENGFGVAVVDANGFGIAPVPVDAVGVGVGALKVNVEDGFAAAPKIEPPAPLDDVVVVVVVVVIAATVAADDGAPIAKGFFASLGAPNVNVPAEVVDDVGAEAPRLSAGALSASAFSRSALSSGNSTNSAPSDAVSATLSIILDRGRRGRPRRDGPRLALIALAATLEDVGAGNSRSPSSRPPFNTFVTTNAGVMRMFACTALTRNPSATSSLTVSLRLCAAGASSSSSASSSSAPRAPPRLRLTLGHDIPAASSPRSTASWVVLCSKAPTSRARALRARLPPPVGVVFAPDAAVRAFAPAASPSSRARFPVSVCNATVVARWKNRDGPRSFDDVDAAAACASAAAVDGELSANDNRLGWSSCEDAGDAAAAAAAANAWWSCACAPGTTTGATYFANNRDTVSIATGCDAIVQSSDCVLTPRFKVSNYAAETAAAASINYNTIRSSITTHHPRPNTD